MRFCCHGPLSGLDRAAAFNSSQAGLRGGQVSPGQRKSSDLWGRAALYASMGFIIPGAAVAGYFLGQYLDRILRLGTILPVAGAFVGTADGIGEVLQILPRRKRNADQRNSSGPDHTG